MVIDDTFNSNPAGCEAALDTLARLETKRRVVVTPGMVELGPIQDDENEKFAAAASELADDVVLVARTNRHALEFGAAKGNADIHIVDTREEAVAWVREHLGNCDAVLYENDLPDHFP
jgi:UDP-N-acetylmuramoyl-tripeptide--D-alanyl-D-alanine ligase